MTTPKPAGDSTAFRRGAVLLTLCVLTSGTFAGLAGEEVGNQDLMFTLAFIFLGIVTVGIFALAWVDSSSRPKDQPRDFAH